MKLITYFWTKYINWCDSMGLTPDNRRCCMATKEEPELKRAIFSGAKTQSAVNPLQEKVETITNDSRDE